MQFLFEEFSLDIRRGDLRLGDEERPLEPRAFALLCLLVENHDRLVSKDEILEKVWDGRIVTESAVSTVVKALRKALGDDGEAQRFVRTVRGRGFRFVSPVRIAKPDAPDVVAVSPGPAASGRIELIATGASPDEGRSSEARQADGGPAETIAPGVRPSIAVLPFNIVGFSESFSAIGDALPTELISSLSRLRWLKVIARGSSFRFRQREVDPDAVREALGVSYCITGTVEIFERRLTIVVELIDTTTHSVVWSGSYPSTIDAIHDIRSQIVSNVIAALELNIPLNEAGKARVSSPDALDAWSEYHIGLQHMYRFNRADNEIAAGHFERATRADPRFARAFAARSFTSFQSAFLKYSPDPRVEADNALKFAEKSLALDPLDPFGNFNLARTHWLAGDPDGGLEMLGRAIEINPNFAQGYYAHAWTDVMAGRGEEGLRYADLALALSPLDPMLYAMRATRGFAHMLQGDYADAAEWAERGARSPGSHFLIGAIAVAAHHLNGDDERANYWAENVRGRRADASVRHFFTAFPFVDARIRREISDALVARGFPADD